MGGSYLSGGWIVSSGPTSILFMLCLGESLGGFGHGGVEIAFYDP